MVHVKPYTTHWMVSSGVLVWSTHSACREEMEEYKEEIDVHIETCKKKDTHMCTH